MLIVIEQQKYYQLMNSRISIVFDLICSCFSCFEAT